MPDDLHDRDILDWSEREADLLRRLSRGERLNEVVDWPHVIEEVADLGLSELRACEGLLRQALLHLMKLHAEPTADAVSHWRAETIGFLGDASSRVTPSMRRRIDLDALWRRAARQIAAEYQDRDLKTADGCPFSLDELLAEEVSVTDLVARLRLG